jgi:hypothetical protein
MRGPANSFAERGRRPQNRFCLDTGAVLRWDERKVKRSAAILDAIPTRPQKG